MTLWLIALIFIPILLGLWAQMKVSSAYEQNIRIPSRGRISGAEAADAVMRAAGIHDVQIVRVPGKLTDHYDPVNRRLALSEQNYHGTSLAALGVAAHEAGHAIQHKVGYSMMQVRQNMVPVVNFAAPIAYMVTGFGFFLLAHLGALPMMIGIAALGVLTLFQLVTLPVEFDASRRAKAQLVTLGILGRDEMEGVNETLDAAALTYVAAFVSSLGNLLYLVLLLTGGRRDE